MEAFCISCNEMEAFVYQEYKDTIHYTNRTGVRDNKSMDYFEQGRRGVEAHITGSDEGKRCINCLLGIAHSLPALCEEDPSAVIGTGKEF